MEPLTERSVLLKRLVLLGYIFILMACLYTLVSTILVVQHTGTLRVGSPSSQALLSITQANHQAVIIGTGIATIRLNPGVYQVSANYGGNHADAVVQISKGRTITRSLNPQSSALPSVDSIGFPNIDTFINSGLTSTQINNLKLAFFKYKPSAKIITIIPGSVKPGPHDPNTSVDFTINFKVTVDAVPYSATISYADLDNIRLYLYNSQDNSLVFDSGTLVNPNE
jgi:uncharacterized membrane protein